MFRFFGGRTAPLSIAVLLCFMHLRLAAQHREFAPSPATVDMSVDPCVDFYAYACGAWAAERSIPADQERIAIFGDLVARNQELLQRQLERAAAAPSTRLQRQYGGFYDACIDTRRMDSDGLLPLQPTLKAIAKLSRVQEIGDLLGNPALLADGLVKITVERDRERPERWIAALEPAPLTLPSAQDYLDQSPTAVRHRALLQAYLLEVFVLLGDPDAIAQQEVKNVLTVETALAGGKLSAADARDPLRTYHPQSLASFEKSDRIFEWPLYFAPTHLPAASILNVKQPAYLRVAGKALRTLPLAAWQSYLRVHSLTPMAPYLSFPFRNAAFQFFQTDLRGVTAMQPQAQSCTTLTDRQLGDAVGQDWLKQNFPEQRKQLALDVLDHLRAAFQVELTRQGWLSVSAEQEAQRKLAAMRLYVAAPEHWRDYASLNLGHSSFIEDLHAVKVFNETKEFDRVRSGSQDHRWFWTVPTADANYDESENDIEIPAGILQPPYLSEHASLAANYGAFGMLAGHEFTHGFDDSGSHYDEKGRLHDWFTPRDKDGFNRMTSCEVAEYGHFEALPGLHLDSRLELGEITADNGGLKIAYDAFLQVSQDHASSAAEAISQKDAQQFFISFAQIWCEKRRPEYQRVRGQTDPHPPGEFRVNGAVQNLDAFGTAFACHRGQPMMPANSCQVW